MLGTVVVPVAGELFVARFQYAKMTPFGSVLTPSCANSASVTADMAAKHCELTVKSDPGRSWTWVPTEMSVLSTCLSVDMESSFPFV
jgi:hypothetical protein